MSFIAKLLISLLIGAVASILTTIMLGEGQVIDPVLLIAFCLATVATAMVVSARTGSGAAGSGAATARSREPGRSRSDNDPRPPARAVAADDAEREQGTVKWFNGTKGFGFIIRDNGEEIFVHFRSIRGEGRRGLRDGQKVSFVVAQRDKGPQAEDVEALDQG